MKSKRDIKAEAAQYWQSQIEELNKLCEDTYARIIRDRVAITSFMAMGGARLLAIGTILGHKASSMTKRYSHLSPEYLQSAVAVIDRAPSEGPRQA